MTIALVEIVVLLLLALLNGLFAMSEISIISARRARLQQLAEDGDAGANEALNLLANPGRFLSTVQIGITLIGVLAGVFGGATLSRELASLFDNVPLLANYSQTIGVMLVVMGITYLTLVLGELVPKQIGLNYAETISARVARPMTLLSRIAAPLVWMLDKSTMFILRVLHISPETEQTVTEEEIIIMLEQATQGGDVAPIEEQMVGHVFRLGDRKVSALLTPRPDVVCLDVADSTTEILQKISTSDHSRYPVVEGSLDKVLGVVQTKALLVQLLLDDGLDITAVTQRPLFIPEGVRALDLLEKFKKTRVHMALVIDEYGGLEGLVTVNDILEAIVGDLPEPGDTDPEIVEREDGSWLIDGGLPIDEFLDLLNVRELPAQDVGAYQTVGGLVMTQLERVPHTGDLFDWEGWQIEVVDMDGRRVDRVLATIKPTE